MTMESLSKSRAALQESISKINPGGDTGVELPILAEAFKALLTYVDDATLSFAKIDKTVTEHGASLSLLAQLRSTRKLSESRCITNLKALTSNKQEFRSWHEKFVNAVSQVFGTQFRKFTEELNSKLDQDKKLLSDDELRRSPHTPLRSPPLAILSACRKSFTSCLSKRQKGKPRYVSTLAAPVTALQLT